MARALERGRTTADAHTGPPASAARVGEGGGL
jgi:hypothetical protein